MNSNTNSDKHNEFLEKSILIVEDDQSNYELLKAILRKTKTDIEWARNGLEAIEFCKSKIPDIILMDIKMPNMDGFETVSRLRKMGVSTPIIAQTAYARIEDKSKILKSGFNAYLSKPIKKIDLINALNEVLLTGKKEL
jgi:CheY-like chemotaxis protein